jgi:hypothetical protein
MSDVNSEQRKTQEARDKVRVTLWSEQNIEKESPRCKTCISHQKLILQEQDWVCRECGKKTPVAEIKHEKKLTSKFSTEGLGSFILSQKGAKRKRLASYDNPNSELSEEDLNDLRNAGFTV